MDSCSYFKLIGCFILISIATAQETQKACCLPRNCKEAYEKGKVCSGVYTVKPDELPAFDVYCDMSNGGGWTVFQRRMDGSVNFYLNWADYEKGFGDLKGEFWLGLNKINRLTAGQSTRLRVDMADFNGNKRFATYSKFNVGNAVTKYKLTVSGYKGNAGDSLSAHNGMKFSTKNQDNDAASGNCAIVYKGAWWYRACHASNLNGLYLVGHHSSYANGVNWYHFKGHYYSLKTTEMKLRSS
ncbi:PREDICTED: ficolin-1-like isoform X2 [Amphimedon queenslandica]|uniref:Fibrinogen C-terminal domain-containing protein n=1 Tax=Amphimedon queenslandica TaxID=400682 RepID=A0AAN0J4S4_AMPQE|nr:PREDICTED: ficolin-1-like isoform X2 [Amphimedon queenslandica]|eukprot:XP_019851746.1 PREDICTED: ficolin-1-like isoform X2 [Amphimedon queenslandica]